MGKTTIIMVAVLAVTVGVYEIAIRKIETSVQGSAEIHAFRLQAEEIAKSGVHLAVQGLRSKSGRSALEAGIRDKELMGGTVTYITDNNFLSANHIRIIAQADYKGIEATVVVVVLRTAKNDKGERWQIVEISEVTVK